MADFCPQPEAGVFRESILFEALIIRISLKSRNHKRHLQ